MTKETLEVVKEKGKGNSKRIIKQMHNAQCASKEEEATRKDCTRKDRKRKRRREEPRTTGQVTGREEEK